MFVKSVPLLLPIVPWNADISVHTWIIRQIGSKARHSHVGLRSTQSRDVESPELLNWCLPQESRSKHRRPHRG